MGVVSRLSASNRTGGSPSHRSTIAPIRRSSYHSGVARSKPSPSALAGSDQAGEWGAPRSFSNGAPASLTSRANGERAGSTPLSVARIASGVLDPETTENPSGPSRIAIEAPAAQVVATISRARRATSSTSRGGSSGIVASAATSPRIRSICSSRDLSRMRIKTMPPPIGAARERMNSPLKGSPDAGWTGPWRTIDPDASNSARAATVSVSVHPTTKPTIGLPIKSFGAVRSKAPAASLASTMTPERSVRKSASSERRKRSRYGSCAASLPETARSGPSPSQNMAAMPGLPSNAGSLMGCTWARSHIVRPLRMRTCRGPCQPPC